MFSHLPVRSTRYRHRPRHLNFEVMERFELSCLFQSGHNIRCGPRSPASPCHTCPTTKRTFFSRCHHSPDDVMWWRSATRHVLVATGTSATQIMSPIRFRHCATSGGEQPAHATRATNLSERFPPGHKQNYKNRNAHCTTTRRRKLLRRLC